jgi:hypothetical protein
MWAVVLPTTAWRCRVDNAHAVIDSVINIALNSGVAWL